MANLDLIVRALRAQCPGLEILEHEPMRAHCSFRIGGPARALVRPASAEETAAVCRIVRDGGAQPLIIGNGTNLLVTDGDVDRIVVQLEPWEDGRAYDRLGLTTEYCEILNVRVPCVTIPVGPGRNLAGILELAAMNNRQKGMGYNAAQKLADEHDRGIDLGIGF